MLGELASLDTLANLSKPAQKWSHLGLISGDPWNYWTSMTFVSCYSITKPMLYMVNNAIYII